MPSVQERATLFGEFKGQPAYFRIENTRGNPKLMFYDLAEWRKFVITGQSLLHATLVPKYSEPLPDHLCDVVHDAEWQNGVMEWIHGILNGSDEVKHWERTYVSVDPAMYCGEVFFQPYDVLSDGIRAELRNIVKRAKGVGFIKNEQRAQELIKLLS